MERRWWPGIFCRLRHVCATRPWHCGVSFLCFTNYAASPAGHTGSDIRSIPQHQERRKPMTSFEKFASVLAFVLLFLTLPGAGHAQSKWIGTAPICDAQPSDCADIDMDYVRSSKCGDGSCCVTGRKVKCSPRQKWLGTAPICDAQPSECADFNMEYVRSSKCGNGSCCVTGRKILCAAY